MGTTFCLSKIGCIGLILLAVSCDRADPTRRPPLLEDTSSHSLSDEVMNAITAIEAALENIDTDPAAATELLDTAEKSLRHLVDFYIPLYEAREHAYNAYRHLTVGETSAAEVELDQLETRLLAIADSGDKSVLHAMESTLEHLEDTRTALNSEPIEALEHLRELANRLTNMIVKGGLIVG